MYLCLFNQNNYSIYKLFQWLHSKSHRCRVGAVGYKRWCKHLLDYISKQLRLSVWNACDLHDIYIICWRSHAARKHLLLWIV